MEAQSGLCSGRVSEQRELGSGKSLELVVQRLNMSNGQATQGRENERDGSSLLAFFWECEEGLRDPSLLRSGSGSVRPVRRGVNLAATPSRLGVRLEDLDMKSRRDRCLLSPVGVTGTEPGPVRESKWDFWVEGGVGGFSGAVSGDETVFNTHVQKMTCWS